MSNHSTHSPRFPIVRRFWKPAAVTGAGGTAIVIWFEEIVIFAQDILALIFLPILAGAVLRTWPGICSQQASIAS